MFNKIKDDIKNFLKINIENINLSLNIQCEKKVENITQYEVRKCKRCNKNKNVCMFIKKGKELKNCMDCRGKRKQCMEKDCVTPQAYKEGGKRGFCISHGGYPLCISCKIYSVKKNGTMCSDCDPIKSVKKKKRMKTKENAIAKWLDDKSIKYEREVKIKFDCFDTTGGTGYAYIDFVIYLNDCIIILEVDEGQHKSYLISCENRRLSAILGCQKIAGIEQPIRIIRFNPDNHRKCGELIKVSQKDKTEYLYNKIINYKNTKPVELHYLFYDTRENGFPNIMYEAEFNYNFKECVISNKYS